jgi:hypothetical protein|nr:MAG TPA: hypothetical protein [Caudoviricetes sp.]
MDANAIHLHSICIASCMQMHTQRKENKQRKRFPLHPLEKENK